MSEPLDVILQGDALETLKTLPDGYVNTIVTSPPYFALRDYGVDGQMGLEKTPAAYIENMTVLFNEVRRVLRDDGVCWVNMGDSYCNDSPIRSSSAESFEGTYTGGKISKGDRRSSKSGGIPAKNLLGMPWRLAFALQDDGWILRSDCIWAKPNPMPESVTDRPTKSHEYVFLFSKAPRYWYDADGVREDMAREYRDGPGFGGFANRANTKYSVIGNQGRGPDAKVNPAGRNLRTVWSIPTEATSEAHFATYPQKLVERCILAGCPDRVCTECGKPWVRDVERESNWNERRANGAWAGNVGVSTSYQNAVHGRGMSHDLGSSRKDNGFFPTCTCGAQTRPGIVLDPFMGSGTTGLVARRLGRHYVGIELNPDYVAMANRRLAQSDPMKDHETKEGFVQRSLFDNV